MQNHPLKCRIAFREVRRKLLLALEQHETTTDRRDRDVVCGEVFADVTGRLNGQLQVLCDGGVTVTTRGRWEFLVTRERWWR